MPDTRTMITVNGAPLAGTDLFRVQSVHVEEALGSQDKVSVVVAMVTDNTSRWTSPIDALVGPAVAFGVTLQRGTATYSIDARSVSANWNLVAGGLSTLTVEGMDRSVDMDRRDVQRTWTDTTDSAIATTLFNEYGLAPQVDTTPAAVDSNVYSPQQNATDWAFLKGLAGRNGFDVHVETISGTPTGVFKRVDTLADPQGSLDLGYGALGGTATASVQLLAGQEVHVTRTVPGTTDTDAASDRGTGHAMAPVSLGGATVVRTNAASEVAATDAQTTATAMAERSAFAATLSATLVAPDAPLVRARRTITINGLGGMLSGLWLVKSVTHTITQAGHTQAINLTRNALGVADSVGGVGGALGSLAGSVGVSL